jgi:hypothetical protein
MGTDKDDNKDVGGVKSQKISMNKILLGHAWYPRLGRGN